MITALRFGGTGHWSVQLIGPTPVGAGGTRMKTLTLTLGGVAAAWMAAPTVAMTVRGTLDDRARAAWRATCDGSRPAVVPAQRRAPVAERLPA